jgi:hypothetical protein
MRFQQIPTKVSKSSSTIRAIRTEEIEPELEPLIPAEPSFNRTAYECWLEDMVSHLVSNR